MARRRRADPTLRREELIDAAQREFAERGVAGTAISDIVKAAGVAQGTFYLYFAGKDDIVTAVAERAGDSLADAIEAAVAAANSGVLARFQAFFDSIAAAGCRPAEAELAAIFHQPENRAVHDRMAERVGLRIAGLLEDVVRQGVAEGVFHVADPVSAAWFVLGGLSIFERAFAWPDRVRGAVASAQEYALRALGYQGSPQ